MTDVPTQSRDLGASDQSVIRASLAASPPAAYSTTKFERSFAAVSPAASYHQQQIDLQQRAQQATSSQQQYESHLKSQQAGTTTSYQQQQYESQWKSQQAGTTTSYQQQQYELQQKSQSGGTYQQQFEIQKSQALQKYHQQQAVDSQRNSQQEAARKNLAVIQQTQHMSAASQRASEVGAVQAHHQQQFDMQKLMETTGRSASYQQHFESSPGRRLYQSSPINQTGAGVVISENRYVDHEHIHILNERVVEHEVRVPKKITREDVVEKVIVIPERVLHEETVEDVQTIREKIIEIAKPIIQERVVEVPEIEIVERVVEVPEIVYQEKIVERPRPVIEERIIEVPKIVYQEKIVEVPEIEYREVPVERIVEVPEVREQIVYREVPVPQYVEKPVAEYVDVHEEREVVRTVPVPVEAVTTCEFKLPRLRPRYTQVNVPLYVPRFVEVPVALDAMSSATVAQAESFSQQVSYLASQSAVSLCEVENLAHNVKSTNFEELIGAQDHAATIAEQWMSGKLQVDPASMSYTTSSTTAVENIALSETVHHGKPIVTQVPAEVVESARAACEAQIAAAKLNASRQVKQTSTQQAYTSHTTPTARPDSSPMGGLTYHNLPLQSNLQPQVHRYTLPTRPNNMAYSSSPVAMQVIPPQSASIIGRSVSYTQPTVYLNSGNLAQTGSSSVTHTASSSYIHTGGSFMQPTTAQPMPSTVIYSSTYPPKEEETLKETQTETETMRVEAQAETTVEVPDTAVQDTESKAEAEAPHGPEEELRSSSAEQN